MIDVRDYLRDETMPHVLCPGCAHGIVLRAFLEAVGRLGLAKDELAVVAGIGCSSRLVGYIDFCTLHSTHGRAPAFATGIKLARPDLNVVVLTGDGDGLAIGGNHLIHAARRNIDLTFLLFNNAIYGMTGGQLAPTTPEGAVASTAPFGNVEPAFDACALMAAAGATFVARAVAYEAPKLVDVITEALAHKGCSFIDVVSDCPVYYGRYNSLGEGPEMLAGMKRADAAIDGLLAGKRFVPHIAQPGRPLAVPTGILHRAERPEYTALTRPTPGNGR
ncbi:MAG: 2-oxoacid:ferredoxin oxidoreductase subunit beta [Thermoleophilia bacterium]|nr:2-oxoacid:ferredoxin oxidoreductase subunit beta [Thermoleophilia bacterium]